MGHLRYPSEQDLRSFLASQSGKPFSYVEVGSTSLPRSTAPDGYDLDHRRALLGMGGAVFDAARAALSRWAMFPRPWTRIEPPATPLEQGRVVAVVVRAFGAWWLNACRIVYLVDEKEPVRRFGFAYGTLPGHVESGEERFLVEWLSDDTVWYDVRAFSRPRAWFVRCAYPLARRYQRRFVRDSQEALKEALNPG